jgi:hypothetical protein
MHFSDLFCCVPVYGVPLNHEVKTEDFLFLFLQSVSRANTVIMKVTPDWACSNISIIWLVMVGRVLVFVLNPQLNLEPSFAWNNARQLA